MKVLFTFLFTVTLLAQNNYTIQSKARAYGDSISLRYAPSNFQLWQHTNKVGYTIERFTISRNGTLSNDYSKLVIAKALKPQVETLWQTLAERDKYAGIYAAALYSSTFNVQGNAVSSSNLSKQIALNENRYSFALFSADLSRNTAIKAALLVTDRNVSKGEKYLYKIYPAAPLKGIAVDTGYVFIAPEEISPLPKVREVKGEWGNKQVILSWDIRYDKGSYTTYEIERSEDGKSFKRTHENALTNLRKDGQDKNLFYRLDSLPANGKVYYYRARGMNAFGELGPYSDVISGKGIEPVSIPIPGLNYAKPDKDGIRLKWNYPDSVASKIKGFKILRAENVSDTDPEIISSTLAVAIREFVDTKPKRRSFYYVQAIDLQDRPATSFPLLGHILDSIPPAPPRGMSGLIDSNGIMKIRWAKSPEEDLLGYRVFIANRPIDEFSQITNKPVADTVFSDTVSLNTLASLLYVRVVALDKNYNPSDFSQILEVKRPDIIPPQPPVFTLLKSVETGIEINWKRSPSRDVVLHVIYRRREGEKEWATIQVLDSSNKSTVFLDEKVEKGKLYEYLMIAVDDDKLESSPSKIIPVAFKDDGRRPAVEKLYAYKNVGEGAILLDWKFSDPSTTKFFVYRSENDQGFRFYSRVDEVSSFTDKNVKAETKYRYKVCAVYSNGLQSEFSKVVEVLW